MGSGIIELGGGAGNPPVGSTPLIVLPKITPSPGILVGTEGVVQISDPIPLPEEVPIDGIVLLETPTIPDYSGVNRLIELIDVQKIRGDENVLYYEADTGTYRHINVNLLPILFPVDSVFGRTGDVIAVAGDYNTDLVTEASNLYYTQARFDAAYAIAIAATSIDELSDVDTVSVAPVVGQALIWDNTNWVPGAVSSDFLSLSDTPTDYATHGLDFVRVNVGEDALEFISISTTIVPEGTNLYYTEARVSANADVVANTAKVSADGSVDTHSDVDTSTTPPNLNEVLKWDGANWIPGTDISFNTFLELTDVDPVTYVGQATKVATVNVGETGLDFSSYGIVYVPGIDSYSTPPSLDGQTQNLGTELFLNCEDPTLPAVTALNPKVFAALGASSSYPLHLVAYRTISSLLTNGQPFGLNTTDVDGGTGKFKLTTYGYVNDVNTSAWGQGDILYVDPTTPGEMTNVRPVLAEITFGIATVTVSHATAGTLFVSSINARSSGGFPFAGTYQNIWFTGDPNGVPTFYEALREQKGSVATLILSQTVGDNQTLGLANDFLSETILSPTNLPKGAFEGFVEVIIDNADANERIDLEIYACDAVGVVADSGILTNPVGDLGVRPVLTLTSGISGLNALVTQFVRLDGSLIDDFLFTGTQRARFHWVVTKIGTAGGNKQFDLYFGNTHETHVHAPVFTRLTDLYDVYITTPADQSVLKYDSASTLWIDGFAAAVEVTYDNSGSGLVAVDVQAAIDENATAIGGIVGDYVDLSTNQTVAGEKTWSNKATFNGTVEVAGGGAFIPLRVTGTATGTNWSGRIIAGGPSFVFLMGQYNDHAWLGAHNAALSAWADFYINPDGTKKTLIGRYSTLENTILTIDNLTGNSYFENGNVGIGTDTPSEALDVIGNVGIDGRIEINYLSENVCIGITAGNSITSGEANVFVGTRAGTTITTGDFNTGIGRDALSAAASGTRFTVAIGSRAGAASDGISNMYIGSDAGRYWGGTSSWNTIIGNNNYGINGSTIGASENVIIGYFNAAEITTGVRNTIIGTETGRGLTSGSRNILIGYVAQLIVGTDNDRLNIGNTIYGDLATGHIGIGTATPATTLEIREAGDTILRITGGPSDDAILQLWADRGDDPGDKWEFEADSPNDRLMLDNGVAGNLMTWLQGGNVGIGTIGPTEKLDVFGNIISYNFITDINNNVIIGLDSNVPNFAGTAYTVAIGGSGNTGMTGTKNFLLGYGTGASLTSGEENVMIGYIAGTDTTSGDSNIFIGESTARDNTTGQYNTVVGKLGLSQNETGHNNVVLGRYAARLTTTAVTGNVVIGMQSGYNLDGDNNVIIGAGAAQNIVGDRNIILGTGTGNTSATGSNELWIDNDDNTIPLIYGNFATRYVGIGTTSPLHELDVRGTVNAYDYNINQVADPSVAPTGVVSAGGAVDTGTHVYYVTFYTASGETHVSPLSAIITTTGGNNTVTLTIPVSTDPRVIGRNLYRSKAGQVNFFQEYVLDTVANNVDTEYIDTLDDASLGAYQTAVWRINTTTNFIMVSDTRALVIDPKATFLGIDAGANVTTGGFNTLIGNLAGTSITNASSNTFIGESAGDNVTSSNLSVAVGAFALGQTASSDNVAIGGYSLFVTTASSSVAVGKSSLQNVTTGPNTALGHFAGAYRGSGTDNWTSGNYGIYLGYRPRASINGVTNEIVIGNDVVGLGDNTVIIGNSATTYTSLKGRVSFDEVLFSAGITPATEPGGLVWWNDAEYTLNIATGLGPVLQVGQEIYLLIYNDLGGLITNGTALRPKAAVLEGGIIVPTVQKTNASTWLGVEGTIMVATMDIPDGEVGLATRFGRVRGLDASGTPYGEVWNPGDQLYISETDGELTNVRPEFPSYNISIGGAIDVSAAPDGEIIISITRNFNDTFDNFWNGTIRESFSFTVTESGGTVTGHLDDQEGNDILTYLFEDGFYLVDTSSTIDIVLTPGTDIAPVTNYVYVLESTKALTLSTVAWPVVEHIKVAQIVLQSATTTGTDGPLRNQNFNDHLQDTAGQGHLSHIGAKIRRFDSQWDSGAEGVVTVDTGPTPDDVWLTVTSGSIFQMHPQPFDAFDLEVSGHIHVANHNTTPYVAISNLNTQLADSQGNSLNNASFSFVVWGVVNSAGEPSQLMMNLPTDSYSFVTPDTAVQDPSNYAVYTIPAEFQGVGFLIARFTFQYKTDDWILYNTEDLRGKLPNTSAGGGAGGTGVTTFLALTDVPASYLGEALKIPQVNAGETALEFTDTPTVATLYFNDTNTYITEDGGGNLTFVDAVAGTFTLDGITGGSFVTLTGNQTVAGEKTWSDLGTFNGGVLIATGGTPNGIYFGDGDTGIYEIADDRLIVHTGGTDRFEFYFSTFRSTTAGGPSLQSELASTTNPTVSPHLSDDDTGLGWAGADTLSLIAGGVEGLRIDEATSPGVIRTWINPDGAVGAGTGIAFGDGDSSIWEVSDDTLAIGVAGLVGTNAIEFANVGGSTAIQFASSSSMRIRKVSGVDLEITAQLTDSRVIFRTYAGAIFQDNGATPYVQFETTNHRVGIDGTAAVTPLTTLHLDGGVGSLATGLAFGDGDTGFYEETDDNFIIMAEGVKVIQFLKSLNEVVFGSSGGFPAIAVQVATDTNPVFRPTESDSNTGIGAAAADILSLIAGGVEGIRIDSITSPGVAKVKIGLSAFPASSDHTLFVDGSVMIGTAFDYAAGGTRTDFVVGHPTGQSRFLFGQSNGTYGGFKWLYNATTANATMVWYINGPGDVIQLNQSGEILFLTIGDDDTEDHLIAIDDSTGLLTKRSVASLGIGTGDVSWGTATNEYIVFGSASGDIESSSNFSYTSAGFQLLMDGTTGASIRLQYGSANSLIISAATGGTARFTSPDYMWFESQHATLPHIAFGSTVDLGTFITIGDTSNTADSIIRINNASDTLIAQFQEDGTIYFPVLGSDDTEDHVIAIDDATGLLTKRSVASIGGGIDWGTATNEYIVFGSSAGDIQSNSLFSYDTTNRIMTVAWSANDFATYGYDRWEFNDVVSGGYWRFVLVSANVLRFDQDDNSGYSSFSSPMYFDAASSYFRTTWDFVLDAGKIIYLDGATGDSRIWDASGNLTFRDENNTGGVTLSSLVGGGSSPWTADTNGITYGAGNVGINAASHATFDLRVAGGAWFYDSLFVGTQSTAPDTTPNYTIVVGSTSTAQYGSVQIGGTQISGNVVVGQLSFFNTASSATVGAAVVARAMTDVDVDAMNLEFWTSNATPTLSLAMTIDYLGNVGIGTATPDAVLTVETPDEVIPELGANGGSINSTVGGVRGLIQGNVNGANYYMQVQRIDGTATAYNLLLQPKGQYVGIGLTGSPVTFLEISTSHGSYGMKVSQHTGTGYAPASILLEATTTDTRGQGIFCYNTVADRSWYAGVAYTSTSNSWIIASKTDTTFDPIVAHTDNALFTVVGSTKRVGIGTGSPDAALHINSPATPSTNQFKISSNEFGSLAGFVYGVDNVALMFDAEYRSTNWYSTDAGSSFAIYKNLDKFTIRYDTAAVGAVITWNIGFTMEADGKVGIGTNDPVAKCHVYNNIAYQMSTLLTAANEAMAFRVTGRNTSSTSLTIGATTAANYALQVVNIAGDGSGVLSLNPYGGDVGIGTSLPAGKLEVVGQILVGGTDSKMFILGRAGTTNKWLISDRANIDAGTVDDLGLFSYDGSVALWEGGAIKLTTVAGGVSVIGTLGCSGAFTATGSITGAIATSFSGTYPLVVSVTGTLYSHSSVTYTGSTGVLLTPSLHVSGNVGIGDTSPDYKLDITASGNTIGLQVKSSSSSAVGGILMLRNTHTGAATGSSAGRIDFFKDDGSTQGAGYVSRIWSECIDAGGTYNLHFSTGQDVATPAGSNGTMTWNYQGRLGINDTTPSYSVDINGTLRSTSLATFQSGVSIDGFLLQDSIDRSGLLEVNRLGSTTWAGIQVVFSSTAEWSLMATQTQFGLYDDANSEWILVYNENLEVTLYYNGNAKFETSNTGILVTGIGVATDWTATSDRRLKHSINSYENLLDKILLTQGMLSTYIRNEDESNTVEVGYIAQDILPIFPEVVGGSEAELYDLSYMRLGAIALEGVALVKTEVDELRERVVELEDELNKLKENGDNHN